VIPPVHPDIPNGATEAQISEANQQHTDDIRTFHEYIAVQTAFKKQIIDSVDPLYLHAAEETHIGLANKTVRQLLG
jgi:hypothetical protein